MSKSPPRNACLKWLITSFQFDDESAFIGAKHIIIEKKG